MNIQKIIEELLRARLYHSGVRIRTEGGPAKEVLVRDVHYDGSRSSVVVSARDRPRQRFSIQLSEIRRIEGGRPAGEGAEAMA